MCDERTEQDIKKYVTRGGKLNRRDFSKLSAAVGLASFLPPVANAVDVIESNVEATTPDGVVDCYFVRPSEGKHPGVLIWPDILGLRPAFMAMGKRLAESGYSVLVVNPFYRDAKAPVVKVGDTFGDPAVREVVLPMRQKLTAEANFTDAEALVSFLDNQDAVDSGRKMGTTGYCMGGPIVMRTAAVSPNRIGAIASFHGGGLATDQDDSPHLLIPDTNAHVLHAVAENDDEEDPAAKVTLATAYEAAGLPAEIEVYEGTMHGWCPPDSAVYNEAQAERAWTRLLALFETALA
ncbi:MAG: dienelactone hydrolase family protein [Proteobacteria bacterium]|jgi:carboxymethylenebutenolidase|nr:dienelactone hydrolase family protein [Pseudomonadota bacterium]